MNPPGGKARAATAAQACDEGQGRLRRARLGTTVAVQVALALPAAAPALHLIQILLPLYDRDGRRFARALYDTVAQELTAAFGGITAHARAPARGLWNDAAGDTTVDDIVVYEVMADHLDRVWWAHYRDDLQQRFAQDELVVRALAMHRL